MEHDYGLDTFLVVLQEYGQDPICPPRREPAGIIRLTPKRGVMRATE